MTTVAATEFRSKCLSLMEQVRETRLPLTVTRGGRQLVRVVPPVDRKHSVSLEGTILFQSDDITSTGERWEADAA